MSAEKLNWLRAGVLGANDGIVSVSGVTLGFLGASQSNETVAMAGILALVAGAVSMGAGEYASVAAQNDSEYANEENVGTVAGAVIASMGAFTLGGLVPLLAFLCCSELWVVVTASLVASSITGYVSAKLSGGRSMRAVIRNVLCAGLALLTTYLFGTTV